MASSVRINGSPTPVEDINIGDTVTLSNFDDTGVTTWAWQLMTKPAGSTATLSSNTNPTSSFVADLEGAYRIKLTTNSTAVSTAVCRIVSTHTGLKLLARDETEEGDSSLVEGWAKPLRESMQFVDKRIGLTTRKTVYFEGTTTTGPKVLKVTGSIAIPNGDVVPTVDLADVVAGYGALVFFDDSGALTQNTVVRVVEEGLSELIADPDTLSLEDSVYMGVADGSLSKTQGSANALLLGYCAEVSGGNRRIWFAPSAKISASSAVSSLAAIGAAPNANGATIAGTVLNLEPASATFGGVVTTGSQTFGGTKTFSSAIVTGDLTVDTNTLYVDSTNNRVGIGNASPSEALHVTGNVRFSGALMPNNAAGTVGQVLLSGGAGAPPTWYTSAAPETLAAIGAAPNANGATLSANTLTLQPASGSFGGVVTTGTQTLAGYKTFTGAVEFQNETFGRFNVGGGTGVWAQYGTVGTQYWAVGQTGGVPYVNITNATSTYSSAPITSNSSIQAASLVSTGDLTVDTDTLYVDSTNNRVGIGTATPAKTLDVNGQGKFADILGLAQIVTGSLPAPAAGNEGYVVYDTTTNTVKFSDGVSWSNIGAGMGTSIGGTVTSGTTGSILFVGAASALSQDNTGLFWDDTNNRLGLGTATPSYPLHIVGSGNARSYVVNGFANNNPAVVVDSSGGKAMNMIAGTGGVGFIWDDTCSLAFVSDAVATIRAGTTGNSGTVRGGFDASYNFYVGATSGNSFVANNTAAGVGTTNIFAGQFMINNSSSGAVGAQLWLNNPNNVVDSAVRISFNNDATTDSTPQAVLDVINNQTGNFQSDFVFKQWNGVSLLERVRFKSNGEIHFTSGGAGTSGYVLTSQGTGTNPTWAAPTVPIGNTVTSGTTGSVLFVGAASALTQDNANLFWDDTNNRLGIGNSAPTDTLHVTGQGKFTNILGLGKIATGSLPAAAAGNEGYVVYDSTTKTPKFSNGAAWRNVSEVAFRSISASDNLSATTDTVLLISGNAAAVTVTLPAASTVQAGRVFTVKDGGLATTYNITIARSASDTIDGATSQILNANYSSVSLMCDGSSKWYII